MSPPLRVVLTDDHVVLRALLRAGLHTQPGVRVVGEAGTGEEALRLATTLQPDVLVLDVDLPGDVDSADVVARLANHGVRVLMHSAHDDPVVIGHFLRTGADGYLSKDQSVAYLHDAIVAVAAGQGRWFRGASEAAVRLPSPEADVLAHLAGGGRPATLAAALGVDPASARQRLDALCSQLDAVSWVEALARAWGAGLLTDPRPGPSRSSPYSMRVNVPGQASSARAMSYGA